MTGYQWLGAGIVLVLAVTYFLAWGLAKAASIGDEREDKWTHR